MIHPKNHHKCFARLACVKHAASVHPEPGSNSLKKFAQDQNLAWLIFYPVLFTLVLFFKNYILLNFQGYVTVQLSRFFLCCCLSSNFFIISGFVLFVKNFFNFFSKVFLAFFSNSLSEYWFYHWFALLSRTFFIFLNFLFYSIDSKKYGEGGIWTLAPRERSTPLAGAPLQPLEYFSRYIAFSFK